MNVDVLLDQTVVNIRDDETEIRFTLADGRQFLMYHRQDWCESVFVEDINGDLCDLVRSPILIAEEESNNDEPQKDQYDDSHTWTFYRFATVKGFVTIRWYGASNGYYSESVNFDEVTPNTPDGEVYGAETQQITLSPRVLAWNDGTVKKLIHHFRYKGDPRSQYLDTSILPILADALEEAGYTGEMLLTRCRKQDPAVLWLLKD